MSNARYYPGETIQLLDSAQKVIRGENGEKKAALCNEIDKLLDGPSNASEPLSMLGLDTVSKALQKCSQATDVAQPDAPSIQPSVTNQTHQR